MSEINAFFSAEDIECSGESRTIRGIAVPWNVIGRVSDGRRVKFLPGSLDASARPVSLRDHDRTKPIGTVFDATDDGSAMRAAIKVSTTRDGDEALTLAADKVLRAMSVGVNPKRHRTEHDAEGPLLVVEAGEWDELSVLVSGAFPGADITEIAASTPTEPDPPAEPDPAEPEEVNMDNETPETPATITPIGAGAGGGPVILGGGGGGGSYGLPQQMTLHDVARICAAAPKERPGEYITAALSAVTTSGNAGVMQRVYLTEVKGLINYGRATIAHLSQADLPPAGMRIEWPIWTTLPTVDVTTGEKVQVPTGPVSITTGGVDVQEFAGAADISLRLAQRSNPSFMEQYFRGCAEIYARKTNGYVLNAILGAAAVVAPATTFLGSIQAHMASYDPSKVPGGPLFVGMSWDVGVSLIGITVMNGPAFWEGSVDFGNLPLEMQADGLVMYVDRQLPAKTLISGFRDAATWYEDPNSPAEIRVVDVSLLGIDAGVYGYGALGFNFIGAGADTFRKTTYTVMPTMMSVDEPLDVDSSAWGDRFMPSDPTTQSAPVQASAPKKR